MTYDRRDFEERQLEALKRDIADRLRPVCERVPDEDFDELVDRIARVERKYEQQRADDFFSSAREPDRHPPSE